MDDIQFCLNYVYAKNEEVLDINDEEIDLDKDTLLLHGLSNPDVKVLPNEKVIVIQCNPFDVDPNDEKSKKSIIDINLEFPEEGQYALEEYKDKKLSIVSHLNPDTDKYQAQQIIQVTKEAIFVFRFEDPKSSYLNIFTLDPKKKTVSHDYMIFSYIGNPLNLLIIPKRIEYSDGSKEEMEVYKNDPDDHIKSRLYKTPIILVDNVLKYIPKTEYLISYTNYYDEFEIHYNVNHI